MNPGSEFAKFDKAVHDRISFNCGESELNEFIRLHAARHMKAGVSITMVLPAEQKLENMKYPICAYYTVTPSSISRKELPALQARKLPHYPVPVFLLAQMAVNSECQNSGLGKVTLIKALEYLQKISSRLPAYAVIVDCLNKGVTDFYSRYGFKHLCEHNGRMRMFLPMKTVNELFSL